MAKKSYVYLVCVLLLCTLAPAYAQVYTVTDLGVLSTSSPASFGCGVSPSGNYATGYSFDSSYKYRMWRWTSATGMQKIDTTFQDSRGFAVNNAGHIAGVVNYPTAAYYNGSLLKSIFSGFLQSINSLDRACGWNSSTGTSRALIYNGNGSGSSFTLGVLAGVPSSGVSMGYGINEYGKAVGASNYSAVINKYHAFLWTPTSSNATTGSMADIHTLANFEQSYAKAINDNDDVVGFCQNAYGEANKNAWRKLATGQMELLPALAAPFYYQGAGYGASEANGINNSGVIVGSAGYLNDRNTDVCFAVRWIDGQIQDLNHCIDLRSPIRLREGNAIGASGHIVGTGRVNNETHAFLLTPIAEPTVSPTPSIASISPATVRAPKLPVVLHVMGQGFTDQSVVFCKDGSYVIPQRLTTRYISSTELEADFNNSNSISVFVLNPYPGGGESNWVSYVPTPDLPPVAVSDTASTLQDTSVDIDVLLNDSDPEGDTISIGSLSSSTSYSVYNDGRSAQGGYLSIQTIDGKQFANYTPPAGFSGTDTFYYQAKDQYGYYSITVPVTVTVIGNAPPVALADTASVKTDIPSNIDVLANDTDPDGDTISIGSLSSSFDTANEHDGRTWQGGWVTIQTVNNKEFAIYTSPSGFTGMDTFVYQAKDQYGALSDAVLVTVNVAGNNPPVAIDDSATVVKNTSADLDVLKNDSDPDGDAISILSVDTPGWGGSAWIVTLDGVDKIHYQPAPDFTGTETFTYTISDSQGATTSATVVVSVDESAPPVAVDDIATVHANNVIDIDVLANDSDPNPGNTQLLITDVSGGNQGGTTFVLNIGGRDHINYAPATDFVGAETFTYTIMDDLGLMSSATVTVNVTGILSIIDSYADPRLAAAGDIVQVWAQVAQGDYPITSVTADGFELTRQPSDNWWSGAYPVTSDLGRHWIQIVATDSVGNTATSWEWYRTVPLVYANSKALRQPIMANACNNFLFAISGKVNVVDDYRFWLNDGGAPVLVYCVEKHGLGGYNGQVRARGQWIYSGDYLYVTAATNVTKLE